MKDKLSPILIFGVQGFLGTTIERGFLSAGYKVIGTCRKNINNVSNRLVLNVTNPFEWPRIPPVEYAVLAFGIGGHQHCNLYPDETSAVNVSGVKSVAENLAKAGVPVMMLSSNAVFNGDAPLVGRDNPPDPISEYGVQKLQAEHIILETSVSNSVLRLTQVLDPTKLLIKDWVFSLKVGDSISAYDNKFIAPITPNIVFDVIHKIFRGEKSGIFHCSPNGDISYYDLAVRIAVGLGFSKSRVIPVSMVTKPKMAKYMSLGIGKKEIEIGFPKLDCQNVVQLIVENLVNIHSADQSELS